MWRMTTVAALVLACACGDDGADDTGGGPVEEMPQGDGDGDGDLPGDGDGADEPVCRTLSLASAVAGEKVNAAFCVTMAYPGEFGCEFRPADNAVVCTGIAGTIVVLFDGDDYGLAGWATADEPFATVIQGTTGAFEIEWDTGELGSCTVVGDVATLCVDEPVSFP